jgi:hypothetical protein
MVSANCGRDEAMTALPARRSSEVESQSVFYANRKVHQQSAFYIFQFASTPWVAVGVGREEDAQPYSTGKQRLLSAFARIYLLPS